MLLYVTELEFSSILNLNEVLFFAESNLRQ